MIRQAKRVFSFRINELYNKSGTLRVHPYTIMYSRQYETMKEVIEALEKALAKRGITKKDSHLYNVELWEYEWNYQWKGKTKFLWGAKQIDPSEAFAERVRNERLKRELKQQIEEIEEPMRVNKEDANKMTAKTYRYKDE